MNEEQKAELLREINTLINGRACQIKLGEAILSITRRVNTLTEIAIIEASKGKFAESDAIINEITGPKGDRKFFLATTPNGKPHKRKQNI